MSLRIKFNLVMFIALAVGMGLAYVVSKQILEENAKEEVLQNANIMMEMARGIRKYTVNEVKPVIQQAQAKVAELEESLPQEENMAAEELPAEGAEADMTTLAIKHPPFIKQTVPAYAASSNFDLLRLKYPEYAYNEAALNPTNPAHRAADWERDIIDYFKGKPDAIEHHGVRSTPTGDILYLALPMRLTNPKCLDCHTTPEMAPPSMVELYGPSNGFGWELNDVIAAQVVSVPMELPLQRAQKALHTFMLSLLGVFALIWLMLNVLLHFVVISPIRKMADKADSISKGNIDVAEFEVKGKDEVASLSASFNRMHRSLASAFKLLKQKKKAAQ